MKQSFAFMQKCSLRIYVAGVAANVRINILFYLASSINNPLAPWTRFLSLIRSSISMLNAQEYVRLLRILFATRSSVESGRVCLTLLRDEWAKHHRPKLFNK